MPTDWEKYGIPPRQPSMTLWAHLLGKDKLPAPPNSEIIPPPIAPVDKNGTSMRILLHDTQVHLERFSVGADKLCSSVEETKREITTVHTLFQREHETLRNDIVDLVNRSQTELQKALGSPAQASMLERLTKDVDRRLEALDKRIDAIQALNESQGQSLQIQTQTLHTIQDQQGTIIAALMPLLPLLQAVPLHIESARNRLDDTIVKSSRTFVHTSIDMCPPRAVKHKRTHGEKRSSSTLRSDGLSSPSPLPHKRPRITETPQGPDQPCNITGAALAIKETFAQAGHHPIRHDLQREDLPQGSDRLLASSLTVAPSSLNRQISNTILINPKTPRRPLAELCLETQIPTETPSFTQASTSRNISTTSRPNPAPSSSPGPISSPRLFAITPSAQRPPRLLCVHSSVSDVAGTIHVHAPAEMAPKLDLRSAIEKDQNPSSRPPGIELTSRISLTPPRPIVIPRASLSSGGPPSIVVPRPLSHNLIVSQPKQTQLAGPGTPALTNKEPRPTRPSMKLIPMSSVGIRERQLPFREGRRFIPLQDSDDDEIECG